MTRHVHVLGICGYATSGAALLAQAAGDRVTGSDDFAYPPMTDLITDAGIEWVNHSDPANLDRFGVPDLVVVGNQTRPHNDELLAVRTRGIPFVSEIEFYRSLAGERTRLSVCGTHGKTTTSSLLVHMLETAGCDPGFRLGSTSLDLGASARLGSGPFVFEGDEYTTAPWDARAKFLHTDPDAAAVTRLELDHPDVYPTLDAYRAPFVELARTLPEHGLLALCADDPECTALAAHARCRIVTYGVADDAGWRLCDLREGERSQQFRIVRDDAQPLEVSLTMPGVHNAQNACAALVLAAFAGVPEVTAVTACAKFKGPARRFEVLNPGAPVIVVDDYAHHPTEVRVAVGAARRRWPKRRIVAVHTPHTYSRTRAMLDDYRASFVDADVVVLGPIEAARERGQDPSVRIEDVAARVPEHIPVHVSESSDAALRLLHDLAQPGDVLLVLSLGGFDKLAPRLLETVSREPVQP